MGIKKWLFRSKNPAIASIDESNVLHGVAPGQTEVGVYDESGNLRQNVNVNVTAKAAAIEPTGIKLNKESITVNVGGMWRGLVATVSPADATNKTVIWESSNNNVAVVDTRGQVYGIADKGDAIITAYTYDKKYSAQCSVSIELEGTRITKVSPDTLSVSADGETKTVSITRKIYGGYDSGYTDFSDKYDWYNITNTATATPSSIPIEIRKNTGNARTFKIWLRGNTIDEDGVWITVNQAGSTTVASLKYYDETSPSTGESFGAIYYCAAGYGKEIKSKVTVDKSWLSIDQSYFHIESNNKYTSSQLLQYEDTGKINGVDPGFNGVAYWCRIIVNVASNTTGSTRTGHVTFPGNKVLTVTQNG